MPQKKQPDTDESPRPLTPLPKSLREWYRNEENVVRFKRILEDPVFREGVAVLMEQARPTQRGVMHPDVNAERALGLYAGYCEAIHDMFTKLTDPVKANLLTDVAGNPALSPGVPTNFGEDEESWEHVRPKFDFSSLQMPDE